MSKTQQFIAAAVSYLGDECILWPYALDGHGYPSRKGWEKIHQLVCVAARGLAPKGKTEVAHWCGNRRCLNPEHLRWATHAENMQDKLRHGTHNRGEQHPNSELTSTKVLAIRASRATGVALAREYGVTQQTICDLRKRRSWAWL